MFVIYHFETQSNVGGYLGLYLGVSLIQVRIQGITNAEIMSNITFIIISFSSWRMFCELLLRLSLT